jgi:hypothetical protein
MMLKTTFKGRGACSRGACAAELALLVPFVYLPLVVGAMYIGWLATARERVHESNHYALWLPGEQSASEVQAEFFREFTGPVTQLVDCDDKEPDVPSPGELWKLFDAFTKPISWQTDPTAHVEFYLDGSVIRSRMVVNPGESGFRVRPEGEQVNAWHLLDNNIPKNLSDLLVGYLHRRNAYTEYLHSWVLNREAWAPTPGTGGGTLSRWTDDGSSRGLRATGDSGTRAWNLYVPNPAFHDQWTTAAAVRWDKTRMARDQTPPAAQLRGLVPNGCSNSLPDYEKSDDFWHPGGQ